jgi:hypothetical protein
MAEVYLKPETCQALLKDVETSRRHSSRVHIIWSRSEDETSEMESSSVSELTSLRHQLDEARANLSLIEHRMSKYVHSTEIPLQLVKEKGILEKRIDKLAKRIRELSSIEEVSQ